jgi:TRAP-type C4-dicarboxylate transport system substrate-binding protein
MNRTRLLILTIALLVASSTTFAATTRIKLATIVPQASSWGSKMTAASEEIKEKTEGRVQLKIYWGGVQGTSGKVMQKMKINQLQGGDFTPTDFQNKMPDLNIYGLPFVFESMDEAMYVRERMDETLASGFDEQGFVTFGFAGSFAIILSNSPVRGLDDLKGRKVWLPEGDAISDRALKRLQLVPSSKPLGDVLTGLKTGLFDVVAMPAAAAVPLQLHTAVKYFTDMPVIYAMQFTAIDKKVFNKLSAEDQAVMHEVLGAVYDALNEDAPGEATNAVDALGKNGVQSVEPNAGEFAEIQKIMAENNRDMAKAGMFSLDLLDTMQAHISDYRAEQAAANETSELASGN